MLCTVARSVCPPSTSVLLHCNAPRRAHGANVTSPTRSCGTAVVLSRLFLFRGNVIGVYINVGVVGDTLHTYCSVQIQFFMFRARRCGTVNHFVSGIQAVLLFSSTHSGRLQHASNLLDATFISSTNKLQFPLSNVQRL